MMHINLAPSFARGPVFDPDATGWRRVVPRREWWGVLPLVVLCAPVIGAVVLADALTRRDARIA